MDIFGIIKIAVRNRCKVLFGPIVGQFQCLEFVNLDIFSIIKIAVRNRCKVLFGPVVG